MLSRSELGKFFATVPLLLVLVTVLALLPRNGDSGTGVEESIVSGSQPVLAPVRGPIAFERNDGQLPADIEFGFRAQGVSLFLAREGLMICSGAASGQKGGIPAGSLTRITFLGANPNTKLTGQGALPARVNSLMGDSPDQWVTGIPLFSQVRYREIYTGIDLLFYGRNGELEYDFEVSPGVDPSVIRMQVTGPEELILEANGNLVLAGGSGLHLKAPLSYERYGSRTRPLESRFVLNDEDRVSFQVESVEERAELVIDPVLVFSSVFGGSGFDSVSGVAVDSGGFIYVAGTTRSSDFPTLNPIMGWAGNRFRDDVFVSKFNPEGTQLIYSTYIGGKEADGARAIAVDSKGRVAVTGSTSSVDFPLVNPTQAELAGKEDGFVLKLNAQGNDMLFSTFLGGSELDRPYGLACDSVGNVYVAGLTESVDFPTAAAFQAEYAGGEGSFHSGDAFVAKFSPTGAMGYSTYLGGSRNEEGVAVAVDSSGAAYVTGKTGSSDFPSTTSRSYGEAFVTKVSPNGNSLAYSTRYGGGYETGTGIAVDGSGQAFVVGYTLSQAFQTTPESFQPFRSSREGVEAFLFKLSADGNDLLFSTFFGGSLADELPTAVDVDSDGSAWVVGRVSEMRDFDSEPKLPVMRGANLPLADPIQAELVRSGFARQDCFISRFDPTGRKLLFSTYLGGGGSDSPSDVAVAPDGTYAVVAGTTDMAGFPTTAGSFSSGSSGQGFVTKIGASRGPGWMTGPFANETWDDFPLYDTNGNGHPDSEDQPVYALRNGDSVSLVCPAVPNLGSRVTARLSDPHPITGRYQTVSGEFRGIVDDFKVSSNEAQLGSTTPATFGSDEFFRTFMGTITGYDSNFRANSFYGQTEQIFKDGTIKRFAADMALVDSDLNGVIDSLRVESDGSGLSSVLSFLNQTSLSFETNLAYFDVDQDGHADFASIPWTIIPLILTAAGVEMETPSMVFVPLGDSDGDGEPDSSLPDLNSDGEPDSDLGVFSHTSGPANPEVQHKLYFAQFGNGRSGAAGITSQILLFNLDKSQTANAKVQIRTDSGALLPTVLGGQNTSGELNRSIPPGGLITLKTDGNGPVTAGSVEVTSDRVLGGVVVFGGTIGVAGVGASSVLEGGFLAPVDVVASDGVNTGVAVVNPLGSQLDLDLELLNQDGQVLARAKMLIPGNGHSAKFVTELPWDVSLNLSNFRGLLRANTGGMVAATVLRTKSGELSTMPVAGNLRSKTPNPELKTDPTAETYLQLNRNLSFAQFGDGGAGNVRIFSQIMLMNLNLNKTATVLANIRNDGGGPISVDINGGDIAGEIGLTIPPGGMKVLQTDQQGDLTAGSVSVASDQLLAGVILYGGSVGLAGVGQSPATPRGFLAPVEARRNVNLNTGIAFMNVSSDPAAINLRLLDPQGRQLATTSLELPAFGHKALFVDQFTWSKAVNFSEFLGLIEATGTGAFTGTVIQTQPSILATLPVVPLLN